MGILINIKQFRAINCFSFLHLIIYCVALYGQTPDTALAKLYFDSADIYAKNSEYKMALSFSQKALEIYEEIAGQNHEKTADALIVVGYNKEMLGKYREGAKDLQRAIDIFTIVLGNDHKKVARGHYRLANCLRYYASGEACLKHYNKAIEIQERQLAPGHAELTRSYNNAGLIHIYQQDYEKAMDLIRKAEANLKQHDPGIERDLELAVIYQYMGFLYKAISDYGSAIDFHRKAMNLNIRHLEENHERIGDTYYDLGANFQLYEEHDKALGQFQKALEVYDNMERVSKLKIGEALMNIGTCYHMQEAYDLAISYYERALAIVVELLGKEHGYYYTINNWIGNCYANKGYVEKAKSFYRIVQKAPFEKTIPELPVYLAELSVQENKFNVAIQYYEEAFELLKFNFNKRDFTNAKNHNVLRLALNSHAKTLLDEARQSNNLEKFKLAKVAFDAAIQFIDTLRGSYKNAETKLALSKNNYPVLEGGIETDVTLASLTGAQHYLEEAFLLAEKGKGLLMLEAYSNAEANRFYNIPESLLNKEQKLRELMAMKEKLLYFLQSKGDIDLQEVSAQQGRLFDLKQDYNALIRQFEQEYTDYYRLKFATSLSSLQQVQQNLIPDDQAILEYVVGKNTIFAFLVKANDCKVYQIKKDFPLEKWIEQMRRGMYQYHLMAPATQTYYVAYNDTFTQAAYKLYEKLIAPIKAALPKEVIIIPDGVLGYLPFDALLMELPRQNHTFKSHAYLMRNHQISYCYSATLLEEMQQSKKGKWSKGLLAFAPSFEQEPSLIASIEARREGLGALEHNIPEAAGIHEIFGGELFSGDEATKSSFIDYCSPYRILHLATHGKANDKAGDYSYLAFAENQDSTNDTKLYVRELYNLRLNADLVVLSACETGIGELQRGEGILSLARGFSYAGASSILTTLWSVNDASTKELMHGFYTYLKTGLTKDAALRQAKLDYLASHTNDEAHPFYWAGFIPIGDMAAIESSKGFWWIWGMVLCLLIAIMFFIKRQYNPKNKLG